MKSSVLMAAAAAALATGLPAVAASHASASIDQFRVTLFDLNPADATGPSISFSTAYGSYGSNASSSAIDTTSGSQSGQAWSLLPFGPASTTSVAGGAQATGSLSGTLSGGGVLLLASGDAAGATLPGYSTGFSASAQAGSYALAFTLSPYTLALFTGTADLFAQTTRGLDSSGTFNSEYANASVALSVNGPGPTGDPASTQYATDSRSLFASFTYVFDPATGVGSTTGQTLSLDNVALAASFTNASAGGLGGSLSVNVSVNGSSPIAAVPEPASAALLLAGLGGVGVVAGRRRRRR